MLRRVQNLISQCMLRVFSSQRNLFIFSFIVGALFAVSVHQYRSSPDHYDDSVPVAQYDWAYERWLIKQGLINEDRDPDAGRYKGRLKNESSFENRIDPATEAFFLYQQVNVHCLVLPSSADSARSISKTWGHHCNKLSFFSDKLQDDAVLSIKKMSAKSSFCLLCKSLREILIHDPQFSWILVTTDDTYALPENLRYFVAPLNSSLPHYLGHAMKFWAQLYNWGEAGYTLSRGAVELLINKFESEEKCDAGGKYWKNGDWYLGKHMESLGVKVKDTRDHADKSRFNGYSFRKLLFPGAVSLFDRYWKDSIYLSPDGPKCCSNHAITFHGMMSMSKMHQLEYMFYHLRPFPAGGSYGNIPPPPPKENPFLTEDERLKEAALDKWFSQFLLTTPKNLQQLMEKEFRGESGDDTYLDKSNHEHI